MKRAETKIIGPPFFKLDKAPDNINDVQAAKYLLYGILCDHYRGGKLLNLGLNRAEKQGCQKIARLLISFYKYMVKMFVFLENIFTLLVPLKHPIYYPLPQGKLKGSFNFLTSKF